MHRRITSFVYVAGLLLAGFGCAVNPLTPAPPPTLTLPPAVVLVASATPSAAPPTARPRTPVPSQPPATVASTDPALGEPVGPTSTAPAAAEVSAAGSLVAAETAPPALVEPAATAIPPVWVAPPVSEDVAAAEQYTIDLINAQRANAGLPAYARDETLMGIARARVADMVARGYTGHYDPVTGLGLGRAMILSAGYSFGSENWYGTRTGPPATGEIAMNWFMTDPAHIAGILNTNYTGVGVGIAFNGTQWLLVQIFAVP